MEIARGAEALLTEARWDGTLVVRKERVAKGYRLPELDVRLRQQRTALEAGLLDRAKRAGVAVPRVLEATKDTLLLERIAGSRLKEALNAAPAAERAKMARGFGRSLGLLHATGVAHGDTTTSNALWSDGRVWLIDFGLGRASRKPEDFATDLYVLHEALKAAHYPVLKPVWAAVLRGYRDTLPEARAVEQQLAKVEQRRRYK